MTLHRSTMKRAEFQRVKPKGTRLMTASKLLHHLLPDLVVPLEGRYTADG
jgi:hypothetical protein